MHQLRTAAAWQMFNIFVCATRGFGGWECFLVCRFGLVFASCSSCVLHPPVARFTLTFWTSIHVWSLHGEVLPLTEKPFITTEVRAGPRSLVHIWGMRQKSSTRASNGLTQCPCRWLFTAAAVHDVSSCQMLPVNTNQVRLGTAISFNVIDFFYWIKPVQRAHHSSWGRRTRRIKADFNLKFMYHCTWRHIANWKAAQYISMSTQ